MLVTEYARLVHGQHVEGLCMARLQPLSRDPCEDVLWDVAGGEAHSCTAH
jgi:hypothetical protein